MLVMWTERRRATAPGGDLRRRYTLEQRHTVLSAFAAGASIGDAAAAAGVKHRAAHEWITAAPTDSPAGREREHRRRSSADGTLRHRFSDDEKARAVALVAEGGSVLSAARAVGAGWVTVYRWLAEAA